MYICTLDLYRSPPVLTTLIYLHVDWWAGDCNGSMQHIQFYCTHIHSSIDCSIKHRMDILSLYCIGTCTTRDYMDPSIHSYNTPHISYPFFCRTTRNKDKDQGADLILNLFPTNFILSPYHITLSTSFHCFHFFSNLYPLVNNYTFHLITRSTSSSTQLVFHSRSRCAFFYFVLKAKLWVYVLYISMQRSRRYEIPYIYVMPFILLFYSPLYYPKFKWIQKLNN